MWLEGARLEFRYVRARRARLRGGRASGSVERDWEDVGRDGLGDVEEEGRAGEKVI